MTVHNIDRNGNPIPDLSKVVIPADHPVMKEVMKLMNQEKKG